VIRYFFLREGTYGNSPCESRKKKHNICGIRLDWCPEVLPVNRLEKDRAFKKWKSWDIYAISA
jgi:hypothetical protein